MEWLLCISAFMVGGIGMMLFIESTIEHQSREKARKNPKSIQFSLSDE